VGRISGLTGLVLGYVANLARKEENVMKKAWIPVLFVLCGALGSEIWRTAASRYDVPHAEFVAAAAIPLITCVANEVLWDGEAYPAIRTGAQAALELGRAKEMLATYSFKVVLGHVFPGARSRKNPEYVSISR
jgi:uncharacterized membrane protein YoaK (UPF0700 family)